MANKDPAQYLPTGIQKSYFMLARSARAVLDTALQEYRPGGFEPILVGGIAQLKPALRLMTTTERPPIVSTHLIHSGSMARIFEICRLKSEKRNWQNFCRNSGRAPIFYQLHETH